MLAQPDAHRDFSSEVTISSMRCRPPDYSVDDLFRASSIPCNGPAPLLRDCLNDCILDAAILHQNRPLRCACEARPFRRLQCALCLKTATLWLR